MARRPYNDREIKIAYTEIYRAFGDQTKYEGLTEAQKETVIEKCITQWENSSNVRANSVIKNRAYDEARKLMQEWNTLDFIEYKKGDGAKAKDTPPSQETPVTKKSNAKYYLIGVVGLIGAVAIFFILNKKK